MYNTSSLINNVKEEDLPIREGLFLYRTISIRPRQRIL